MNNNKLKALESSFLNQYPQGFDTEEMVKIGKKHNVKKLQEYVHTVLSKDNMKKGLKVFDEIMKIVTKSSMVSVFEKVKFRDLVREFDNNEKHHLLSAIYENIHGDEQLGFDMLVGALLPYKLAKWPLITVFRAYYNLDYDVFVKPTTVKKVIKFLEIDDIEYTSKPNFDFYSRYRKYINDMKQEVSKSLSPNNPAFSGFLMITIQ